VVKRSTLIPTLASFALATLAVSAARGETVAAPDFVKDIKPILSDACFHCHGPDEATRKGKFRLDLKDEAFRAGKSGKTPIVAGKPEASELIARIMTTDADDVMPPPDSKTQLKPEQKEILKRWVASGAAYQTHWAFAAPVRPEVPKVKDAGWVKNPVDAFILSHLEAEGLHPSTQADKAALLRRLSLDLMRQAMDSTAKLSAFVIFILIGARVFSLTFYGVSGHVWVEHLLTSLPGGQVGFLIFVNIFVFLLAFFLDFFELAFIIIPLLGPVAEKLGIDLIWFGVILGVNMQTSFMHPPFGFALFYLRSVAPKESYLDRVTGKRMDAVTTGQIYWGAVPFVVIQVIMVLLVIMFPQMVMHYKGTASTVDPNSIKIEVPQIEMPPLDFGQPK